MSLLSSRPALRWAVPAGVLAAALIAGSAGSILSADAAPALPERSAAQLLVDLQNAKVKPFSGTVVQKADLGLPALPSVGGQGSADLTSLVTGAHTLRIWYGGPEKVRLALLGTLGESDVIRNGNDLWYWNSDENKATHTTLPSRSEMKKELEGELERQQKLTPSPLPSTPQEAADQVLAAISPTTKVTTDGTARVAGRSAYELVLAPKDNASLVGQVRLAVDSKEHIPLRVRVYAKGNGSPAFEVAFQQISFKAPGEEQFRFTPPPGAKVTESGAHSGPADKGWPELTKPGDKSAPAKPGDKGAAKPSATDDQEPTVIGTGWTSVVVFRGVELPDASAGDQGNPLDTILDSLPDVNGSWGSGKLLRSDLFSALLTDDGRLLVGAVSPEKLYAAAGDPAAKAGK